MVFTPANHGYQTKKHVCEQNEGIFADRVSFARVKRDFIQGDKSFAQSMAQ